jgi:hypothetical protein
MKSMGVSCERLNLLLVAFGLFFACVHGPERRHQPSAIPLSLAGPCTVEAAAGDSHEGDPEAGQEFHESAAAVEPLLVGLLSESRIASRNLMDSREGRLVGFGDTPPPRPA